MQTNQFYKKIFVTLWKNLNKDFVLSNIKKQKLKVKQED